MAKPSFQCDAQNRHTWSPSRSEPEHSLGCGRGPFCGNTSVLTRWLSLWQGTACASTCSSQLSSAATCHPRNATSVAV